MKSLRSSVFKYLDSEQHTLRETYQKFRDHPKDTIRVYYYQHRTLQKSNNNDNDSNTLDYKKILEKRILDPKEPLSSVTAAIRLLLSEPVEQKQEKETIWEILT
jgi:hypothetical protein